MLSVLLNWLIVTILAFSLGFAALEILTSRLSYQIKYLSSYIIAGLVVLTVYAQIYSLFSGVGAVCFLVLIPLSLASCIFFRKKLILAFRNRKKPAGEWIALFIGILFLAYTSSRGYMAYDTALYHAQAIRWIEEYGVVKGLALFHFRLGYNSSSFALSALFSLSWTGVQPMHALSGYFLLLLIAPVIRLYEIVRLKKIRFSDFIRIGMFYYITLVLFETVAPASDFFATSIVFFLVYRFATIIEEEEESPVPYSLLSVLALYAITLKFSAGLMVLLAIKPFILLIKEKKWKQIAGFVMLGLVVLLPTLIRGYIISGWPLYPSTMLGFLHPDWQVPAESAIRDATEIRFWGQKIPELGNYNATFTEWFPHWFLSESMINKAFLVLDAIGIILTVFLFPFLVFRKRAGEKRKKIPADILLLCFSLCASFLLWFTAAPLIRYGYAFVILPWPCAFGLLFVLLSEQKKRKALSVIILFFFSVFILYKTAMIGKEAFLVIREPFYLNAKPYEEYPTIPYDVDGHTFYKPETGDRTGYEQFPAAPYELKYSLRGNSIKEGFTATLRQTP